MTFENSVYFFFWGGAWRKSGHRITRMAYVAWRRGGYGYPAVNHNVALEGYRSALIIGESFDPDITSVLNNECAAWWYGRVSAKNFQKIKTRDRTFPVAVYVALDTLSDKRVLFSPRVKSTEYICADNKSKLMLDNTNKWQSHAKWRAVFERPPTKTFR